MDQISLSLSLPETNVVLEALGQLPYAQVYELIAKVRQQAQAQLAVSAVAEESA
jgi:hypothetical protein